MGNNIKTFEEYRYVPFRKYAPITDRNGEYVKVSNVKDKNEPFFNWNKKRYLYGKNEKAILLKTLKKIGMSKSYFDSACKILEDAGLYAEKYIEKMYDDNNIYYMRIYSTKYHENSNYIFYFIKDRNYDILEFVRDNDKRKIKIPHIIPDNRHKGGEFDENVHDLKKAFKYIIDYMNKKKIDYDENSRKSREENYKRYREYTDELPHPDQTINRPTRTLPRMDSTDTSTFDSYSPKHINRLNEGNFTVKPFNLECKNCGYKGTENKFTKILSKKPKCPKCKSENVKAEKSKRPNVMPAEQPKKS